MTKALLRQLKEFLGDGRIVEAPTLTVRPGTVDHLGRTVAALTEAGFPILPRGGGQSQSGSFDLAGKKQAILDLRDLNRIEEINEADRYVTVEAGCTWSSLYESLKARQLRTPFFGPWTDGAGTVGGTASGNGYFLGSGAYGTMNDTVLGLDVVLADGSLVETGAAAAEGRTPFLRHFGPDLTGLFLGDCGSFGVKARVTLPLIPVPGAEGYASFAYERIEDVAEIHVALARERIVSEQWGFDPAINDLLAARGYSFLEGLTFTRDGTISLRGTGRKALPGGGTAVDGHRIVQRGGWSLHVTVEADSERDVEAKLARVRRIALPTSIKELPAAIPQAFRAKPFETMARIPRGVGPEQAPAGALFPLARAPELAAVTDEYFVRHRALMTEHGLAVSFVTGALERAFSIEAILSWQNGTAARKDAGPVAETLRRDLALLWGAFGATHVQIGRLYNYAGALSSAALMMVKALKAAVDPRNLMNPGVLGLGGTERRAKSRFADFPQNLLSE